MAATSLIIPRRLNKGDTIGIVAPSSPFEPDALDKGISVLNRMGFKTKQADGLFDGIGYLAGTDARRLAQVNAMFADNAVDAIMCARGGFGALKLLSGLDYGLIRSHPKALVGFSDITALHQGIFQKTGLVTFHGPVVTTLGEADQASLDAWRAALAGGRPVVMGAEKKYTVVTGVARGMVSGGNLATLCHLVGTQFHPVFNDAILVIEETNESLYRIDRMLTQMKLAGCFQGLAGVALGNFNGCGPLPDILDLMKDCFGTRAIPIAAGFPWGHAGPNLTIPLGLPARLDADSGELQFLETATR
jgi:muramoyltetrapeptide carboxypeptidase